MGLGVEQAGRFTDSGGTWLTRGVCGPRLLVPLGAALFGVSYDGSSGHGVAASAGLSPLSGRSGWPPFCWAVCLRHASFGAASSETSSAILREMPCICSWLSHRYTWKASLAHLPNLLTAWRSGTEWYIAEAPPILRECDPISDGSCPVATADNSSKFWIETLEIGLPSSHLMTGR